MDIFKWSLDYVREKNLAWLEDRREELVSLLASRLKFLIDGMSFIVICDDDRIWFENYMITKMNANTTRPLLPFFSLRSLYPNFARLNSSEDFSLLNDLISLVFTNGVVYFYIGKSDFKASILAKKSDNSLSLLLDESAQNSFLIEDEQIIGSKSVDMKLIEIFDFFNKSIDAVLFDGVIL